MVSLMFHFQQSSNTSSKCCGRMGLRTQKAKEGGTLNTRIQLLCVGACQFFWTILPLTDSILQAGDCQILRLAENPKCSQVCQKKLGK